MDDLYLKSLYVNACSNGKLEIVKWLSNLINKDNHVIFYNGFKAACVNDKYDLVVWIYNFNQNIDISNEDNISFKTVCEKNYYAIAKWFTNVNKKYLINDSNNYVYRIPYLIIEGIKNINKEDVKKNINDCIICYDKKSNMLTDCGHLYCYDCLIKWIIDKKSCPYCREDLNLNNLSQIN